MTIPRVRVLALVLVAATSALAGCGGTDEATTTSAVAPVQVVPRWNAWLCHPASPTNACENDLATTAVGPGGAVTITENRVPQRRPIDCFYVYPTVNADADGNADLRVDPQEQQAAVVQAARFEQVCRVYAPLYRQTTNSRGNAGLAYRDVRAAWRDYLERYNGGRGVVLIGHSQGTHVLRRLIQEEIDGSEDARKLLVSAILLGGGIVVEKGSDRGGDFANVPACRTRTQTGCAVAYSAFARSPGADAAFETVREPSQQILCVNPAAPEGGKAAITPAFPWYSSQGIIPNALGPPPTGTDWISLPRLYTARCVERGTRAWLLVEVVKTPNDPRPVVPAYRDARGLHAADVSIALDTLVELVRGQSKTWVAAR